MSLKKNLLLGYGVAFALMSLVVAWAIANMLTLGRASDAILRENYRSILAAENMVATLERQDSAVLLLLLGDTERGTQQFRDNEALFLQWLARAKDNITIEGEGDLVASIETNFAAYRRLPLDLIHTAAGEAKPSAAGFQLYSQSIYPTFAKVRATCDQLLSLNESTMYTASVRAGQIAGRATWSMGIVAAAALILTLTFSLLFSERFVQPIRRFMEASRQIASGNYTVRVPVETNNELGRLAGEFNVMATHLERFNELKIDQIITEKRKGEAILASIEDGLVVFDTSLNVTAINTAARRMLGLEFSECSAMRSADILPARDVQAMIEKTVATGVSPSVPEDERIVALPGGDKARHCLYSVTPIHGKDRSLIGIVLLLRDVTRLREVERLKSEFVMAASHELRTPLTGIGMSVDLLREHAAAGMTEKDQELLATAHEEVGRMKALINDLLDLAKIETGRILLDFGPVAVDELVAGVQQVFRGQLAEKGVQFTAALEKDLPSIRADANKITWVLTNLVSNALRHARHGGHIHVTAIPVGGQIHLAVQDDGPGIPPEYQVKIFQKFVQVKGRESGGTGLGLAICKEIVRAHGGTIWVESKPGQGSTFTFTIPVAG
jgi:two-component system, NtrC family, sensor histidine kinase KinB